MARMVDLAKEAFANRNYQVAVEIFERCLRDQSNNKLEIYFGYGDALARCGRIKDSFDVYAHICNQLGHPVPIDKLKHLSYALLDSVTTAAAAAASRRRHSSQTQSTGSTTTITTTTANVTGASSTTKELTAAATAAATTTTPIPIDPIDPLCCAVCEDVLKCPVTAVCGHTFCRKCCVGQTQCKLCDRKFTTYGDSFNQDVLVLRLVEKWWAPEIKASKSNDEAIIYMHRNALDEALKACNESLEKCPNSYQGLLLRSEVLCRLNHFQSALADADNALKSRPTSHKAHQKRACALSGLGYTEDALLSHCISVCINKSTSGFTASIRNDVAKVIQRLIVPSMRSSTSSTPYSVVVTRRRQQRKQYAYRLGATSECDDGNSSSGNEDEQFSRRRRRHLWRRFCGTATDSLIPRQNTRLRNLIDRIYQEIVKTKRSETSSSSWLNVSPNHVDLSDFECVLCYRTLWKPVVTPCGHTYCLVCLDRCLDYSSHCPLCKSSLADDYQINGFGRSTSPTSFSMSKKCVTKFIEIAMQRFIPAAYEKRQIQEIEKEPSVPVFICTTAFPYVPCPLFVYESRYRLMIRRAIESGEKQFGIAQPQSGRQRYTDYGTMLDIRDCVLLGDGCSILSTVGCRRFRVIARKEKDGYDTAKVEYIDDEPVSKDRMQMVAEIHANVFYKAIAWYDSLPEHTKEEILKSFGCMPPLEAHWESITDGPAWAWYIIAILPLSQQLKVEILATTNLEKRLRAIDKTLEYVAAQKRRSVCVVPCEGLQACQAIECCQRATSSSQLDEQTTTTITTTTTTTATTATTTTTTTGSTNHVTDFLL